MAVVDRQGAQRLGHNDVNHIVLLPIPLDHRILSCLCRAARTAVDADGRIASPRWNAYLERKLPARSDRDAAGIFGGIVCRLLDFDRAARPRPANDRRRKQVDVQRVVIVEINIERVIGDGLRQRSRTARPFAMIIFFLGVGAIVRIIRIAAVAIGRAHSQDGVVERALQPIGIARISGQANQITRQFQIGVTAAGRFEMRGGIRQAFKQLALARFDELLFRSPSARSKTLWLP